MKDEVFACFESRKNQYTKVLLKGICVRGNDSELFYPVHWILQCLNEKYEKTNSEEELSFDTVLLIKKSLTPDQFKTFIEILRKGGSVLFLPKEIQFPTGYFREIDEDSKRDEIFKKMGEYSPLTDVEQTLLAESRSYPYSSRHFWPTKIEWPTKFFLFKIRPTETLRSYFYKLRGLPFPFKNANPVFPTYRAALSHWLGKENEFLADWNIKFVLPDYRVGIEKVKISKNNFQVIVRKGSLDTNILQGKYYVDYDFASPQTGDFVFPSEKSNEIPIVTFPRQLYCVLFDNKDFTKPIDYRLYGWGYTKEDAYFDIEFQFEPENLDLLINRGEGYEIEFKRELGDGVEFLETISSFSNSSGGKILIGVDNNGNIVGIDGPDRLKQRIQDLIQDSVEPRPTYNVTNVLHSEKQVIIVSVYSGNDKPYIYRKQGIYIRVGSTDRIASRSELDKLYEQKKK